MQRRHLILTATLLSLLSAAPAVIAQGADQSPPPFVVRGMPGAGHEAMVALAGDWSVSMELYAALGAPEEPFKANLTAHREWVADGRFLREILTGDMPDGGRYWRMGTLGYSNMDRRYEWVTQDALNSGMMIYLGASGSGPGFPASLTGTFTDQGVLGEAFVGRHIGQHTVISIDDADHHAIDIYFTPPGEQERLIDRKVYARIPKKTP